MKQYIIIGVTALALLCSCQKSWEERCAEEARTFTRTSCPRQVDENLVLDSMTYERAENRFCYYYRVTGDKDRAEIFAEQEEEMVATLRRECENSVELKPYKEHGMSFRYIYYSDSTGEDYLDFVFSAGED